MCIQVLWSVFGTCDRLALVAKKKLFVFFVRKIDIYKYDSILNSVGIEWMSSIQRSSLFS